MALGDLLASTHANQRCFATHRFDVCTGEAVHAREDVLERELGQWHAAVDAEDGFRAPASGGGREARSKRPLRNKAGSIISGRLVAATIMTPSRDSTPSMLASSWLMPRLDIAAF